MVLKKALVISLTFLACSVRANNICTINPASADKTVKIQGVPGFFFKVHPDGDYITFIETEHNTLLDLTTGQEFPTVGSIDPVWSPDGKFLTHPGGGPVKKGGKEMEGLQFYHGDEILKASIEGTHKDVKPFNSQLQGVYQSIGVKEGKYKVITDHEGISMADFEYSAEGPKQTSDVYKPCSNIQGLGTDLPMLSKDGRYLSAYDSNSNSTKVYKLKGKECDLALDLGYGTGKVSFNQDSSQISFHVDQFSEFENGYFSGVGKDKLKNVVVLNLEETSEGKLTPASWAIASQNVRPGDGGYYPDFDKHGNLYFLEDLDNNFQMVKVSPGTLEFRKMEENLLFGKEHCVSCDGGISMKSPYDILARMWVNVCGKEDALPMHHYRELVMAIDPLECQKMVQDFWLETLGISKDELLKTCPQNPPKLPQEVGEWDPNQRLEAEGLLKAKCVACHRTPLTYESKESLTIMTGPTTYDFEEITLKKSMQPLNIDELDYQVASDMLNAIMSRKMPKNDPLSDKQTKELSNYLQKRMLEFDQDYQSDYLSVRRYTEDNLEVERQNLLLQYPDATPEFKQNLVYTANCIFGQKNCKEYIAHSRLGFETEASELPESEREAFIQNKIMELKCNNLFEVTPQQCVDWDRQQRSKNK
jgi:hypothetical protein